MKYIVVISTFVTAYAVMYSVQKNHDDPENNYVKQPLPYFRRKVEGLFDELTSHSQTEDPQGHLVQFLVKNMKQIFKDDSPLNADADNNFNLRENLIDAGELEEASSRDERSTIGLSFPKNRGITLKRIRTLSRVLATGPAIPFDSILKTELNGNSFRFMYNDSTRENPEYQAILPFFNKTTTTTIEDLLLHHFMYDSVDETTAFDYSSLFGETSDTPLYKKTHLNKIFHNRTALRPTLVINTIARINDMVKNNESTTKTIITPDRTLQKQLPFLRSQNNIEKINDNNYKKIKTTVQTRRTGKHMETTTHVATKIPHKFYVINYNPRVETMDSKRVCIMCDNVANSQCSAPQSTIITTSVCSYDDPLCYSQHTPFGIVDRGCFSISHNLTIYVCACNLCNHISITDMPVLFRNLREWVANFYELTHLRRLNKSVYKEMSCLQCEVNMTTRSGNPISNSDCLEGRVDRLPAQECKENQLCAVKTIKNQGYIWRGCVNRPLYNYYMTLCDSDLCNYDTIVSLFDILESEEKKKKRP